MKKLEDIEMYQYLEIVFNDGDYEPQVLTKKEFLNSVYYIDRWPMKVYLAKEEYADFDLADVLEDLEISQSMYSGWSSDVYSFIPKDTIDKIEKEMNKYVKDFPLYESGEEIEW